MAVPVIGYLIIFNDYISQHVDFKNIAGEGASVFGIESIERLRFVYFGLIFLGLANILYKIFRPYVMKISDNEFGYIETGLRNFTIGAYIQFHGAIRSEGHFTLHGKYYDSEWDGFLKLARGSEGNSRLTGINVAGDWVTAKQKYEHLLRSILAENFFRNVIKKRKALSLSLILSIFGYFLLFLPSLDLFLTILRSMI
jgi:hypothetical protein